VGGCWDGEWGGWWVWGYGGGHGGWEREGGKGAYVVGDYLRLKHARVEAGLVDGGVLVGNAWPAEGGSGDAVGARVEVEFWMGGVGVSWVLEAGMRAQTH
jgi:hypothetical protein